MKESLLRSPSNFLTEAMVVKSESFFWVWDFADRRERESGLSGLEVGIEEEITSSFG